MRQASTRCVKSMQRKIAHENRIVINGTKKKKEEEEEKKRTLSPKRVEDTRRKKIDISFFLFPPLAGIIVSLSRDGGGGGGPIGARTLGVLLIGREKRKEKKGIKGEERKNSNERGEKVGGRLVRETEREEKRIVG